MEFKKRYEELSKKYKLPSYEELDTEFELLYFQNIMEISFPLRYVRRRIGDRVNWFIGFFQGILNPNPSSLINLEESKFFSKEDKDKMVSLVKDMVIFERESLILDLAQDEKKDAEFIRNGVKRWTEFKKELEQYCIKLKEGWKAETSEEEKEEYFGWIKIKEVEDG